MLNFSAAHDVEIITSIVDRDCATTRLWPLVRWSGDMLRMDHRLQDVESLNAADCDGFLSVLNGVVEHSPWVAERAFAQRPFATIASLHSALMQCIKEASRAERIALFNAHPELAGREAVEGAMTPESTGEQGRLGLTSLSHEEFRELSDLNRLYREKFGFPFIAALRLHPTRQSVIATFRERIDNDSETEIANAISQIAEIVRGRLDRIFGIEAG